MSGKHVFILSPLIFAFAVMVMAVPVFSSLIEESSAQPIMAFLTPNELDAPVICPTDWMHTKNVISVFHI